MGYCDDKLTQDIVKDCDNLIAAGLDPMGVIINKSDIDVSACKFDPDRNNVLTKIALVSGAKAYSIAVSSKTAFNGTTTTLEAGTYQNTFTNNVGFVILNNDPDVTRNVINPLANGEYVVILSNKYKNINKATNAGDSTYQIYGWYQGLTATTLENDKYSEDTSGGWNVVLAETLAPTSALFVYSTDLATTKAMIDSLTAA